MIFHALDCRQISPVEQHWARVIAERISAMVRDWKQRSGEDGMLDPDSMQIEMDIIVVHRFRKLRLQEFAQASILEVWSDFVTIEKYINRRLATFPADVRLRFASQ